MPTRKAAASSAPAASSAENETVSVDGSLKLRERADGSAEISFAPQKGLLQEILARTWGLFITYYFCWYLVPLGAAIVFWGPAVKRVTVVVLLLYLPSYLDGSEWRTGRPWDALRLSRIWRLSLRYFSTRVTREARLDPAKQYVFAYHPHGILVMSRIFFYGGAWEALFPGVRCRVLGATPMFKVPACRELCLAMSAVDAGRKTAERCLAAGLSLMVYPGGSEEIFLTDPNSRTTDLVLLKRKGFVRLALRSGAALVPVFVFGEKWCYRRLNPPKALRDAFLRYLRLPILLFWGRWFTFVPLQVPLSAVVGAPIEVERVEEPSEAQVDALHARYCAEVRRLFDQYKAGAGYSDDETLVIS